MRKFFALVHRVVFYSALGPDIDAIRRRMVLRKGVSNVVNELLLNPNLLSDLLPLKTSFFQHLHFEILGVRLKHAWHLLLRFQRWGQQWRFLSSCPSAP